MSVELSITPLSEDDRNYVLSSWKRTFRFAAAETGDTTPDSAFYPWVSRRIERILSRNPLVLVARDPERPVFVYGYLVAERIKDALVLHWTQVKKPWWGQGIATRLLAEAFERIGEGASRLIYTHHVPKLEAKAVRLGFAFVSLERLYGKEAA